MKMREDKVLPTPYQIHHTFTAMKEYMG